MKMSKTFASLFSGGGVADAGLINLRQLWGVEYDSQIAESYSTNFEHPLYIQNILNMDPKRLPRPDILWISPPCTRASVCNRLRGETDLDIALAKKCCHFIRVLRPSGVVVENVQGYIHFQSLKLLLTALKEQNFWVDVQKFDMSQYGIPQSRIRLIVRASKSRLAPLITESGANWWDSIKDLVGEFEKVTLTPNQYERAPLNPRVGALMWGDSFPIRKLTIRSPVQPSPTLTAKYSPSTMPCVYLKSIHGTSNWYRLSVRACARLMTLPDWYRLPVDFEDCPKNRRLSIKILGNGVPSKFAQKVVESL
jgi:site-specific DNA-cytosine methylase